MENTGFFKTKAGRLAVAFIIVIIAFALIVTGLNTSADALSIVGLVLIVGALLYSPFSVYILKRK